MIRQYKASPSGRRRSSAIGLIQSTGVSAHENHPHHDGTCASMTSAGSRRTATKSSTSKPGTATMAMRPKSSGPGRRGQTRFRNTTCPTNGGEGPDPRQGAASPPIRHGPVALVRSKPPVCGQYRADRPLVPRSVWEIARAALEAGLQGDLRRAGELRIIGDRQNGLYLEIAAPSRSCGKRYVVEPPLAGVHQQRDRPLLAWYVGYRRHDVEGEGIRTRRALAALANEPRPRLQTAATRLRAEAASK